jgi:hypothetical protein
LRLTSDRPGDGPGQRGQQEAAAVHAGIGGVERGLRSSTLQARERIQAEACPCRLGRVVCPRPPEPRRTRIISKPWISPRCSGRSTRARYGPASEASLPPLW